MFGYLTGYLLITSNNYELFTYVKQATNAHIRHLINNNVVIKLVWLKEGVIIEEFTRLDIEKKCYINGDKLLKTDIDDDLIKKYKPTGNRFVKNQSNNDETRVQSRMVSVRNYAQDISLTSETPREVKYEQLSNIIKEDEPNVAPTRDAQTRVTNSSQIMTEPPFQEGTKLVSSSGESTKRQRWKPFNNTTQIYQSSIKPNVKKEYTEEIFESNYNSYVKMKQDIDEGQLNEENIHKDFAVMYDIFKIYDNVYPGKKPEYQEIKELVISMLADFSEKQEEKPENCDDGSCSRTQHQDLFEEDAFLARKREQLVAKKQ